MKVPISWLKDFVDIDINENELAIKLVNCGFEIEQIIYLKDKIQNVITAKIIKIENHPNADKLKICVVFDGKEQYTIVSAAPNIKEGDIVPVALDGAIVKDGKTIKSVDFRGVFSQGMMCSGEELDLNEEEFSGAGVYGILILPENTVLGRDINEIIGNDDIVLDVSITSNRQDCNSILGIAREVAVVTGKKLKMPDLSYKTQKENINKYLKIENKNFDLCPRYMAKVAKDIKIEKSPAIMQKRLKAVGIRPINNIVDVTNYVLVEVGQPLHAFDLNLLEENTIVIRKAEENEKILALDGKEYKLNKNNLVICDAVKPVAVAGVMGGEDSSVNDKTQTIVLESAKFARASIRHTSRQLNLRSDSSQRFEKGIDTLSQQIGQDRALHLMDKYGWAKPIEGVIDAIEAQPENKVICTDYHEINKVLGIETPKQKIIDILNALELETTCSGDMLSVKLPLFREDIVGVNDLAEEVIRIYGYDHIQQVTLNSKMVQGGKSVEQKRREKLKNILVCHGGYEIINYSFITPKAFELLNLDEKSPLRNAIRISNPLGVDFSVMRTTLIYSMIKTIASNLSRGNKAARLFEMAKTYIPKNLPLTQLPDEKYSLCLGFYGETENFYSIKAVVEDLLDTMNIDAEYKRANIEYLHPGRSAKIVVSGKVIGYVGELNPAVGENFDLDKRLYIAELSVEFITKNAIDIKSFKPMSKYQNMERDLAVIIEKQTPVKDAVDIIKEQGKDILEYVNVFDVYEGNQVPKGKKSVAIKLSFRHMQRTLTEEEVNIVIDNILDSLKTINAELR